jgi:translation initiation factor IF-1
MPTNKKGGKKYKKAKKTTFDTPPFIIADEGQQYARIVRKLGDKRFDMILQDTAKKAVGRARGALKGWQDIKSEDIVLVSGRDFRNSEEEKYVEQTYDILGYYTKEQVRKLIKLGKLKSYAFEDIKSANHPSNSSIVFVGDDETDSDEDGESSDSVVELKQNRKFEISSDSESSDTDDIDRI